MKAIDKFLKYLKTDRNTFLTYVLTLVTAYLVVDRIAEILMMIFTGMSVSYWGPITYTLALACPVFAFLFSCSSKYADSDQTKLALFDVYIIGLYILILSMFTQFANRFAWSLFLSVPNFSYIVVNFYSLIKPAFSALALYLPLTTFYPVIKWLIGTIHDTKTIYESIYDYKGINLSDKSASWGPYTAEMKFGSDKVTGSTVKIAEEKRFYPTLICGVSGSGKTSLLFEPMIANDLSKKFFYKEISKEMGFTALKTGIATLSCPYSNEYINANFSLNMLVPNENKLNVYNTYMKKMIISGAGDNYIYRNLGLTYISPDIESVNHIKKVAKAHNLKVNILDPNDSNSMGLNPFVFDDPVQTAIAITTVLKGLYDSNHPDLSLAYRENAANQAVENLAILLKEMYPRLHEGDLPTLEDLLNCLVNFELVENLCEEMKQDEELSQKYSALINYCERNFYTDAPNRNEMIKFVTHATSQLDSLLRYTGVKNILCNRVNTINFDNALKNGEVTLVCTRRGDLGPNIHTAFGLFCILMMQYSVLRRPGTEKDRVPHFLYIDEFADFVGDSTDPLFTLYRKYRVATVISVQNLSQLDGKDQKHRQIITSNCSNKFVFGNNSPEDNEWWSKEIGDKKEWQFTNTYDTAKGE
ncbi:MAG: TraM recognition domain-containing protein, partial [Clostridia bacterium]